jgi:hypothetical protein
VLCKQRSGTEIALKGVVQEPTRRTKLESWRRSRTVAIEEEVLCRAASLAINRHAMPNRPLSNAVQDGIAQDEFGEVAFSRLNRGAPSSKELTGLARPSAQECT